MPSQIPQLDTRLDSYPHPAYDDTLNLEGTVISRHFTRGQEDIMAYSSLALFFQSEGPNFTASYIPIVLFLVVAMAFPIVALSVAGFIRRSVFDKTKLMPYECGVDPS